MNMEKNHGRSGNKGGMEPTTTSEQSRPMKEGMEPTTTSEQSMKGGMEPTTTSEQSMKGGMEPTTTSEQRKKRRKRKKTVSEQSMKVRMEPTTTSEQSMKEGMEPTTTSEQSMKDRMEPTTTSEQSMKDKMEPTTTSEQSMKDRMEPTTTSEQSMKDRMEPTTTSEQRKKRRKRKKTVSEQSMKVRMEPTTTSEQSMKEGMEPTTTSEQSMKEGIEPTTTSEQSMKVRMEPTATSVPGLDAVVAMTPGSFTRWLEVSEQSTTGRKEPTTTVSEQSHEVVTAMTRAYFTRQVKEFKRLAHTCSDPDGVLRLLMKESRLKQRVVPWEDSLELVSRCRDPDILAKLLLHAALWGHLPLLNSVIWRVDLATAYDQKPVLISVFYRLIYYPYPNGMQVLSAMVAIGVSALDRKVGWNQRDCLLRDILIFNSIRGVRVPPINVAEATRLVLQSGAVSQKAMHGLRQDKRLQRRMEEPKTAESANNCYRDVVEAASTPCSLQHLARLAASAALGCHPGRPARIEALPLPSRIKDALRFKDVTDNFPLCKH